MDLIKLEDWSTSDIIETVDSAMAIKSAPENYTNSMNYHTLTLLFQKTSTRTRCAGEIGMMRLGGNSTYLDWRSTNFALADLRDEMQVLSSYTDLILVRFLLHNELIEAMEGATVPVINGCCDRYHPTQAIGDLMTIKEQFGRFEGVRLTYVGVHNNVCNSLISAGMKTGMQVTVVTPELNQAAEDPDLLSQAIQAGTCAISDQLQDAVQNSDAIYTDTWIDMEYFLDPSYEEEKKRRIAQFIPYQINKDLLKDQDVLVMHCLPAHHGYEISTEMIRDPRSIVFDQAANRMPSMQAIMLKLVQADG
ncbi:TPA: ornithine carbamoyltransferase [Candidatus Poribacteria bacterium]|nr:ornithine carbamoyltransferase [Candidatus Poribacteria bacterium]